MVKIFAVAVVSISVVVVGCQKTDSKTPSESRPSGSKAAALDAHHLHEGLTGHLADEGRAVVVTVDEIRGDGLLVVDFHGQSWILYGLNTREIVDGQDLKLEGAWEVMGTHFYGGKKCWQLKRIGG